MKPQKTYLGDGVYAEWNDAQKLVLTTSNGMTDTNTIYLEPEVLGSLIGYIQRSEATP